MAETTCIECEAQVPLEEDLVVGEIVQCPDCGIELEILSLNPVKVDKAPEVEEDWGE